MNTEKTFAKTNSLNSSEIKKLYEFMEFYLDSNKEYYVEFFDRRLSERHVDCYVLIISYSSLSFVEMKGEALFLRYDAGRFVNTSDLDKKLIVKEAGFFDGDLTFYFPS